MDSEIEERRTAFKFARISVRLSGYVLDDISRAQFERWIEGKITFEQLHAAGLARYDKTKK